MAPEGDGDWVSPVADDEFNAARDDLDAAVRAYFERVYPGHYVDAWALATHRLSPDLERENQSVTGLLVDKSATHPMVRGILEQAIDALRR